MTVGRDIYIPSTPERGGREEEWEEEEESFRPCVEWEVPRDFLLHRDHLMPPLVIGFERFEENIWKT